MEKIITVVKEEMKKKDQEIDTLKKRIELLQYALIEATTPLPQQDKRISRKDFIEIYGKCVVGMFEEDDKGIENGPYNGRIYGNDMTIHWNGMYCNCGSGAIIANEIIPGIREVEKDDEEEL